MPWAPWAAEPSFRYTSVPAELASVRAEASAVVADSSGTGSRRAPATPPAPRAARVAPKAGRGSQASGRGRRCSRSRRSSQRRRYSTSGVPCANRFHTDAIGPQMYTVAWTKTRKMRIQGACRTVARSPTHAYRARAMAPSTLDSRSAALMRRRPPTFEVRRKTASRRRPPSMQPRAMTQLTERLMRSDIIARRNDIVVHSRSANMLASVATTMSASGKMDRVPSMRGNGEVGLGDQQTCDHQQQRAEGEHQQVAEPAQRGHEEVTALRVAHPVLRRAVPRHEALPVQPQDLHGPEAPAVPLGEHPARSWAARHPGRSSGGCRGRTSRSWSPGARPRCPRRCTTRSSRPTATSALRRNSPIVPTKGTVLRSLREDMTDR